MEPCVERNPCAPNAHCQSAHHKATCTCPEGFTGDPFVNCYKGINTVITIFAIPIPFLFPKNLSNFNNFFFQFRLPYPNVHRIRTVPAPDRVLTKNARNRVPFQIHAASLRNATPFNIDPYASAPMAGLEILNCIAINVRIFTYLIFIVPLFSTSCLLNFQNYSRM